MTKEKLKRLFSKRNVARILVILGSVFFIVYGSYSVGLNTREQTPTLVSLPTQGIEITVEVASPTLEPSPTVFVDTDGIQGNIPEAIYDYACNSSTVRKCIEEGDPINTKIAHVLSMEGAGLSLQAGPDVLQLLHNRMYHAWTCASLGEKCSNAEWKKLNPEEIPWDKVTPETFQKLVLYIMSQPYTGWDGQEYAAFNGWHMPLNTRALERNPLAKRYWEDLITMVDKWLVEGIGAPSEEAGIVLIDTDSTGYTHELQPQTGIRDVAVQYMYATYDHLPDFDIVAMDSTTYPVCKFDLSGNQTCVNRTIYICFTYESSYNEDQPDYWEMPGYTPGP